MQLAKKLKEEELRLLFNDGITNQFGKKKSATAQRAKEIGVSEQIIDIDEVDFGDSDESDDDSVEMEIAGGATEEVVLDAVEILKEKTIEDIIEEQRAKLAAEGKKGTPVTEESFARW